jgi:hypothetical protein
LAISPVYKDGKFRFCIWSDLHSKMEKLCCVLRY